MRLALILVFVAPFPVFAQDAQIAVAANFTAAAEELGAAFADETGMTVGFSFGATGQLYTQITQGAPFAAFLAADTIRPAMLVDEGLADGDSLFTYATGRLALYSAEPDLVIDETTLSGAFAQLSIADPATAPYGAAALETIYALGLSESLAPRLVTGQNIAQAFQFAATGNAEFGFVALAQVIAETTGSYWLVPQDYHAPILQDAVLIPNVEGADVAAAFLAFLQSPAGSEIIARFGYGVPAG